MPAAKSAPPTSEPDIAEAPDAPEASATPDEAPPDAFEYTAGFDTVYLHVPLTAHPARRAIPAREATASDPARPEMPAQPATVFAWPDGAPADGRWQPTTKQPNQAPDNAGPLITKE